MELRPYQQSAKRAVYAYLRDRTGNPCVVIPTGGGKTPLIASICADSVQVWNGRVLIVAHVKELLEQSADKLKAICPTLTFGIYSAGLKRRDKEESVIIAGVQSIADKIEGFGRFDLLIVDEAHLIPPSGYGRYQTLITGLREINPDVRIIGLTATAFRTDTGMLCTSDGILNHVCYEVSVRDLIAQGHLTKLTSKAARAEIDTAEFAIVRGEYDEAQTAAAFSDVVEQAVEEILLKTTTRKSVLIFCQTIEHAERVAELIRWRGERCHEIYGDTKGDERAAFIAEFRDGGVRFMVNVNVLTTGFDAPGIDCVCLLRATVSPGLYYQMCGRGFRLAPGKTDCLILDFGTNIERHGPVDAIKPKEKAEPSDEPKGKKCPSCSEVVARAVTKCPECGFVWPEAPPRALTHEATATDEEPVSGEPKQPTTTDRQVTSVSYSVHVKKGSEPGHPRTLRVSYMIANPVEYVSEWVCVEHPNGGFARNKAEDWWAQRCETGDECPTDADVACDFADDGKLISPVSIKLKETPGKKFPDIVGCTMPDEIDNLPECLGPDFSTDCPF